MSVGIGSAVSWSSKGHGNASARKWGKIIGAIDKGQSLFKKFPSANIKNSAGGDVQKVDRWVVEVVKKENAKGEIIQFKEPKYYTPHVYQKFDSMNDDKK